MVFNKLYLKTIFVKQRTTFKMTTIYQGEGEDRGNQFQVRRTQDLNELGSF